MADNLIRVPYKRWLPADGALDYVAAEERDVDGEPSIFQIVVAPTMTVLFDDTGVGGVSYMGEADPGTLTSAPTWRIKRITETGADVAVVWADGDASFDNVWDDRASLTYS